MTPAVQPDSRRLYIDWARGLAVLLMIEAHTTDAWTAAAAKGTPSFRDAAILGGFAAPLFLWLAGLAVVLAATRVATRRNSRAAGVDAVCRRGLEIFILAFLFRLQAFAVTPGSYLVTIFRVDILNIMGPAIAAAGLLWGLGRTTTRLVGGYALIAILIAMLAPMVHETPLVDLLPIGLQWYVRPAGDYTTFTAFPWAGFVFAGAACGSLLASASDAGAERRAQIALALCGAALTALGWFTSTRPSIYHESSFWTTSPTWFAMRVGIMMVSLSGLYAVGELLGRRGINWSPIARFGRSSLFVYWIHVELVYGYATWPLRGRLPLWGTAIACALFCVLMYRAIALRDRLVAGWRARGTFRPARAAIA